MCIAILMMVRMAANSVLMENIVVLDVKMVKKIVHFVLMGVITVIIKGGTTVLSVRGKV